VEVRGKQRSSGWHSVHTEALADRFQWQAADSDLHCRASHQRWLGHLWRLDELDKHNNYAKEYWSQHSVSAYSCLARGTGTLPTPNILVELQAILTASNNLVAPPPYIANFDFGNPVLGATSYYQEPYFQATTGGVAVPLSAATVFLIAVQNLHASALLHVTHTPTGQAISTCSIGPGGIVIFFDPLETGGGFTALTLTGVGSTVPAFVMVGA
jgi:hypothetical protein